MEEQLAALIKVVVENHVANEVKLEAIQLSLALWRPAVSTLKHEIDELRHQVDWIAPHPALAGPQSATGDTMVRAASNLPRVDPGYHRPLGHGELIDSGACLRASHHPGAASGYVCVPSSDSGSRSEFCHR